MLFSFDRVTPEHCTACIKWVTKMGAPNRWNLTASEMAILLGMNVSEFIEIQKMTHQGIPFLLRNESSERISLLLGMHKRLSLLGLDEQTSVLVFNRANDGELLKGKSIKNFLLERKSLEALYAVNLYLETSIPDAYQML